MKKLLCLILVLYSQMAFSKVRVIDIEIALCDQLPKNKIYGCLMRISQKGVKK